MSVLHSEPDVSEDYHKVPSWSITEFTEDFQVFGLGVFCSQHQRCVMNEYLRYRPGRDLPRWDSLGPYPFTDKFDMDPLPLPFLISIVIFAYGGPLVLRFSVSGPPFQHFSISAFQLFPLRPISHFPFLLSHFLHSHFSISAFQRFSFSVRLSGP